MMMMALDLWSNNIYKKIIFLVTTSNSAENAEEKVLIIKFDLIILDVMMTGKSGLEFIKDNKSKIDTRL